MTEELDVAGPTFSPEGKRLGGALGQENPLFDLDEGLPADLVEQGLGAPDDIRPREVDGILTEVWIYQRTTPGNTRLEATDTQEVPAFNPITGEQIVRIENVFSPVTDQIVEHTELLFLDGVLLGWKQYSFTKKEYN